MYMHKSVSLFSQDNCLNLAGSPDRLIGVRLLRCFSSWVSLQAVTLHQLASSAMLGNVFTTLSSHQVHRRVKYLSQQNFDY